VISEPGHYGIVMEYVLHGALDDYIHDNSVRCWVSIFKDTSYICCLALVNSHWLYCVFFGWCIYSSLWKSYCDSNVQKLSIGSRNKSFIEKQTVWMCSILLAVTKRKKLCPHSYTTWKTIYPSFVTRRMVGGARPLLPKISDQRAPVGAKSPISNRYSRVEPQP